MKSLIEEYAERNDYVKDVLTVNDYIDCLNCQSACNATGLINTINGLRAKLWTVARKLNKGIEWINHHPLLQLHAYQLAHLTHGREPVEWGGFSKAYMFCSGVKDQVIKPDDDYTLFDEVGNLIK